MSNEEFQKQLQQMGIDPENVENPDDYVNPLPKQISVEDLDIKIEREISGFADLLKSLSSTEARKKALWRQIYENSLMDRRNAYLLFDDLWKKCAGQDHQHAIHGQTLSKYLERMGKSNDQLIKLAGLVSDAIDDEIEEELGEEEMYERMKRDDSKN